MNLETMQMHELIELQTKVRSILKTQHNWLDTKRPSWDLYFSILAQNVASRGSCCRRKVGAILVDKDHNTLSTGYNGKAAGLVNCLQDPCEGAYLGSGVGLNKCEAIHAEINALIRCRDPREIHTAYVTCSPCVECVNALLGTGCKRIVFTEAYAHNEESVRRWLKKPGREWIHLKTTEDNYQCEDTNT